MCHVLFPPHGRTEWDLELRVVRQVSVWVFESHMVLMKFLWDVLILRVSNHGKRRGLKQL